MNSPQNTGLGNNSENPFKAFTSNNVSPVNSTMEFFESNSLVAKIAFLLLVLFAFTILLRIGIGFIGYFFGNNESPKLIDGMVDATISMVFPQEPSDSSAVTIYRSTNASDGIEFTWSTWLYVKDIISYGAGKYKCIFYKGSPNQPSNQTDQSELGLNFPNNAPGLYIAPNTNDLVVFMNTFKVINEQVTISDFPINKWFNVIIRCKNTTLDVYINGTISKSIELHGVPKQNYGNVFVAPNGGFSGYISNLWYYNYALGTTEINRLVINGPNTDMTGTDTLNMTNSNYLSLRWFFYGNSDAYNP